jgi:hypothetical protein
VVLSSAEVYNPKTRTWSAVGSMTTSRIYHTATLMPDGRVLIAGGRMTGGNDTAAMDFFDPATNAFTAAGNLPVTSEFHAALPLPDGRALIIGGSGPGSTLSTLLAVGSTGVATKVGDLLQSRTGHQALYLGNGRICVITGYNSVYPPTEVVDLSTFLSTPHGNLATPRNYSPAFLLSNGKVFVAGGSGATVTSNGELFQ